MTKPDTESLRARAAQQPRIPGGKFATKPRTPLTDDQIEAMKPIVRELMRDEVFVGDFMEYVDYAARVTAARQEYDIPDALDDYMAGQKPARRWPYIVAVIVFFGVVIAGAFGVTAPALLGAV